MIGVANQYMRALNS